MRMAWRRRLSKCWGNRGVSSNSVKTVFQTAVVVAVVAATTCAFGADLAVLRNGNSIRHERHQAVGAVTRLYLGDSANGYIEIPTDQIDRFEKDTAPDPVPVKSQPAVSVRTAAPAEALQAGSSPADMKRMVNS